MRCERLPLLLLPWIPCQDGHSLPTVSPSQSFPPFIAFVRYLITAVRQVVKTGSETPLMPAHKLTPFIMTRCCVCSCLAKEPPFITSEVTTHFSFPGHFHIHLQFNDRFSYEGGRGTLVEFQAWLCARRQVPSKQSSKEPDQPASTPITQSWRATWLTRSQLMAYLSIV